MNHATPPKNAIITIHKIIHHTMLSDGKTPHGFMAFSYRRDRGPYDLAVPDAGASGGSGLGDQGHACCRLVDAMAYLLGVDTRSCASMSRAHLFAFRWSVFPQEKPERWYLLIL